MGNVIEVQNVSMRFNLELEKTDTIKEYVLKTLRKARRFNELYVLRDVTFSVSRGESVALIGAKVAARAPC